MGGPRLGSWTTGRAFGLGRSDLSLRLVGRNNDHLTLGDFDGLMAGMGGENTQLGYVREI